MVNNKKASLFGFHTAGLTYILRLIIPNSGKIYSYAQLIIISRGLCHKN